MKNTLCLKISLQPFNPWSEILVSQLSEMNFSSFEEKDNCLLAYGNEDEININQVLNETCLNNAPITFEWTTEIFPYQNWNEKWEKEYEAIHIDNKISITAPFHNQKEYLDINVLVQAQTSFGTGHHPTTQLVISTMNKIFPFPKKILDMGTGTGVLAILAEKLGANAVTAVDIEDWSIDNAKNNAHLNESKSITFLCGDINILKNEIFDLILANINKNTLTNHVPIYSKCLNVNGLLILSGFLESDFDEMNTICIENQLILSEKNQKEGWLCLSYSKI
ncbi:MAG: 50S ribosomal protein L11 methyltransferase [Flavobacteriia bacterium]|nr:50S ribosomal protein L11 methyltransferase [Flavobacteriia bacterium]